MWIAFCLLFKFNSVSFSCLVFTSHFLFFFYKRLYLIQFYFHSCLIVLIIYACANLGQLCLLPSLHCVCISSLSLPELPHCAVPLPACCTVCVPGFPAILCFGLPAIIKLSCVSNSESVWCFRVLTCSSNLSIKRQEICVVFTTVSGLTFDLLEIGIKFIFQDKIVTLQFTPLYRIWRKKTNFKNTSCINPLSHLKASNFQLFKWQIKWKIIFLE